MSKKLLIYILLLISLLNLADSMLLYSTTQGQILDRSRLLAGSYQYLAALKVLNDALAVYPEDEQIISEFKKNAELYVVHEISNGYQRISQNPQDVEAYVNISEAFLLMDNRIKALEILLEGTFENPYSVRLWRAIAQLEAFAGRPLEASSALREASIHESH